MQEIPEIAVVTETFEAPTEPDSETKLAQEIEQLWSVHSQAQTVLGRTKQELGALRLELGRRLYEMKVLLARPGRAGQWSKFLCAQRIPRASADRYAKKYEIGLNQPAGIASLETIADSVEDIVQKALRAAWPKLRQALTNPETAYQFLCALVHRCETLHAEITDSGITIGKPTTINSQSSSGVLAQSALEQQAGTLERIA